MRQQLLLALPELLAEQRERRKSQPVRLGPPLNAEMYVLKNSD
jgi:hypothetical protein